MASGAISPGPVEPSGSLMPPRGMPSGMACTGLTPVPHREAPSYSSGVTFAARHAPEYATGSALDGGAQQAGGGLPAGLDALHRGPAGQEQRGDDPDGDRPGHEQLDRVLHSAHLSGPGTNR